MHKTTSQGSQALYATYNDINLVRPSDCAGQITVAHIMTITYKQLHILTRVPRNTYTLCALSMQSTARAAGSQTGCWRFALHAQVCIRTYMHNIPEGVVCR